MMKYAPLFCSLLLVLTPSFCQAEKTHKIASRKESLIKKYGASIISGAVVGGVCGYLDACIQRHWQIADPKARVAFWLGEAFIRSLLVAGVSQELQANEVPHHEHMIHASAWMAACYFYFKVARV